MLETLPDDVVYWGGVAIVTLLVLGRVYVGEHNFNDRGRFWRPLRKRLIPWLHAFFQRASDDLYAETEMRPEEYVGTIDEPWRDVRDQLLEAGHTYNPLASLATDPDGNLEKASLSWYHGEKPFPGAPKFLKPRQVHARVFAIDDSTTAVYAHEEATSWRPDLWKDHYRGESMDVELGVAITAYDLGLQDEIADAVEPAP